MERVQIKAALLPLLVIGILIFQQTATMQTNSIEGVDTVAVNAFTASDEIIWETIGNPEYLDPHVNSESFGAWISHNVYETLFTYPWDSAETNPSVPLLAESVDISHDGLNYTFALRQGITFHDGTPFNATCIIYNIERILAIFDYWGPAWIIAEPLLGGQSIEDAVYVYGEGSPPHIGNFTAWKAANDAGTGALIELDTYILRIRLAYSYAGFLPALCSAIGSMISPSYIENHGGVNIGEHNTWMDEHTCGTGPYMVTEWTPDDQIVLSAYDNYWRADETDPAISPLANAGSITTAIIKTEEDVNWRILNIQAGGSDGCYWPTSHADQIYNGYTGDPGDGTLMTDNPNLKLWARNPTYDITLLGFNMNPTINQSNVITESPFTNKDLRYSLSYAFNYSVYIDNILNGFGLQLQGPIPQGMLGHDDDLFMFEYNMTAAVEYWNLAMAAGLDDVWANNSYSLNIYYNSGNTNREKACLLLKDGIEAIITHPDSVNPSSPLTIDVQALEWASYLYMVRNNQLPVFFLSWIPNYADPHSYVQPLVKSTSVYPQRIGLDASDGWNSTAVDGWISDAASSLNVSNRVELYESIQWDIVEHAAYLWVYQETSFHVEYADLNGYVFNPMYEPYFYHYYKTNLPTTTTSTTHPSNTTTYTTTSTTTTTTSSQPTYINHNLHWTMQPGHTIDYSYSTTLSPQLMDDLGIIFGANEDNDFYCVITETPSIPEELEFMVSFPQCTTYWDNGTQWSTDMNFFAMPAGNWSLLTEMWSGIGFYMIGETSTTWTISANQTMVTNTFFEVEFDKASGILNHYHLDAFHPDTSLYQGYLRIERQESTSTSTSSTGTTSTTNSTSTTEPTNTTGFGDIIVILSYAITIGSSVVIIVFVILIVRSKR